MAKVIRIILVYLVFFSPIFKLLNFGVNFQILFAPVAILILFRSSVWNTSNRRLLYMLLFLLVFSFFSFSLNNGIDNFFLKLSLYSISTFLCILFLCNYYKRIYPSDS